MKKFYAFIAIALVIGSLFFFIFIPMIGNFNPWFGTPTIEFPVEEPNNITKLSGYNYPDWGSPGVYHNGIDLVCKNYTRIISPVNGIVTSIAENANPYKNYIMFHVTIMINYQWNVKITFEPNYNTTEGNDFQRSLIRVQMFQVVNVGDEIGILLNGTGDPTYPHIHFMLERSLAGVVCPYQYSSDSAKTHYEEGANITGETICYPGPSADDAFYGILPFLIVIGPIGIIVAIVYLVRRKKK